VVIVGGGIAALAAARQLCAQGTRVELVSPLPCAATPLVPVGGIAWCEDDEARERLLERLREHAAGLVPSCALQSLARASAVWVPRLAEMGVPFQRDADGDLLRRALPGSDDARAVHVNSETSEQVLLALERGARRYEVAAASGSDPLLRRHEHHRVRALVLDDERRVRGCVVEDRYSLEVRAIAASALLLTSNGGAFELGAAFEAGRTTQRGDGDVAPVAPPAASDGGLLAAIEAGALVANAEMLAHHAALFDGPCGPLPVAAAARAEGGRFWVPLEPKEARRPGDIPHEERHYLLEDGDDAPGALCNEHRAAQTIHAACQRGGIYSRKARRREPLVYFDVSHFPEQHLRNRLSVDLDVYALHSDRDPYRAPMKVRAGSYGWLGGLWVDHRADDDAQLARSPHTHATSIEGLYAAGGAAAQYRGAAALDETLLLAELCGAEHACGAIEAYLDLVGDAAPDQASMDAAVERCLASRQAWRDAEGDESPHTLLDELVAAQQLGCGMRRDADALKKAAEQLDDLAAGAAELALSDEHAGANRDHELRHGLQQALTLARLATAAASHRRESRGVHQRKDHPHTEDEARQTLARLDRSGAPALLDEHPFTRLGQALHLAATIDDECGSREPDA
jgi:succinate dehydrogenase / fumarate reductase flavoprotein subunit